MKLRSFEALRGLAALSVVLTHASSNIIGHPALGTGVLGGLELPGCPAVEFFFVLSGFVMALAHGADTSPWRFVWSRVCRLYPMVWVTVGMLAIYYQGTRTFPLTYWLKWSIINPLDDSDIVPVAWTLKLEIGFYALLVVAMLPKARGVVLTLWALATPFYDDSGWVQSHLPAALIGNGYVNRLLAFSPTFLAGLGAGHLYRRWRLAPAVAGAALLSGIALVAARLPFDDWGNSYGPPISLYLYGVGFGLILLGVANLERGEVLRPGRIALAMGLASYPLYLSHLLILDLWQSWMPTSAGRWLAPANLYLFGGVPLASLVGPAMGVWIDRPVQRWLRHPVWPRLLSANKSW